MRLYTRNADGSLNTESFICDTTGNPIDIGDCSIPVLVDFNGDGLMDLVLGTYGPADYSLARNTNWRLYLNSGTKEQYRFSSYTMISDVNGTPIGGNSISFVDFDKDGKKDIVFGSYKGENHIKFGWHRNIGTDNAPVFDTAESLTVPDPYASIYPPLYAGFADLNNDGFLDLAYTEQGSNGMRLNYAKGSPFATKTISHSPESQKSSALLVDAGHLVWNTSQSHCAQTEIEILRLDGSRACAPINVIAASGNHGIAIPKNLAAGIYAARLTNGNFSLSTRIFIH